MGSFEIIKVKLEHFIRRYYLNRLVRGTILFVATGLLYLILTLFIEHQFWLNTEWRTVLFWCFVLVEFTLFLGLMAIPLAQLFNLRKGISFEDASEIIGKHFPEVDDRLTNVLQLSRSKAQSELLIASINQKSKALQPIPFKTAVNFKSNVKYIKYAAIPILIILLTFVSGNSNWFNSSYERVVNYQTAYEPPAPFQFFVVNEQLEAIENQTFLLEVRAEGSIIPETVQLQYGEEVYFLQPKGLGKFQFVFSQLEEDINFTLFANDLRSRPYTLRVLKTPSLENLEMQLEFPRHTGKKNEVVKSSGNAKVPEGTKVTWLASSRATNSVKIYEKDTLEFVQEDSERFTGNKQLFSSFNYELVSSNQELSDYERLAYSIKVEKDAFPELDVEVKLDSLDRESLYFSGQISDDYGLKSLDLVYYKADQRDSINRMPLTIDSGNYSEFIGAFPGKNLLEEGVAYELYFEVRDNDRINGFKSNKSAVFNFRKKTQEETKSLQLQQQNETIKNMDDTFKKLEDQDKKLEEFSKTQKEKENLNYNDKKKFESFLKRQRQQEELMKNFNKNLQENLENFENKEEEPFKEDLMKRLKENEEQLKKDEKLLNELEKMQDKINKEDFSQKLEELAKQNQNKKRSMKQLLELTKRFYVTKKAEKLQSELENLADKQKSLSEQKEENTSEKQKELNEEFEDLREELDELKKDNKALQKPMNLPEDKLTEERIEKDQKTATEELEKKEQNPEGEQQAQQDSPQQKAEQKQKAAAKKMQKMSENLKQMQQGGGAGGAQQLSEDAEMLRQILDNLVLFSFDEEGLMNQFKSIGIDNNQYGKYIVDQNTLRSHFEHVDDSLFALSLRQPKLSEDVNKQISNVYFNIDKALGQLSENRLYQGISYQQYSVTAANELANILSDMLDNMEEQLNMMPSPGGQGEQLQDIIISQQELNKKMQESLEKSQGKQKGGESEEEGEGEESDKKEPKPGEDKEGEGAEQKEGESGKEGEEGQEGGEKDGSDGKEGNQQESSKNNGYGEGGSEEQNKELYQIYQKQQQLRQALENRIENSEEGEQEEIKNLIEKMEDVELDLINNGITNQTLAKMLDLQHRLLQLKNATFMQEQEQQRESETNTKEFSGSAKRLETAKEYFNRTELLNRQALPLKGSYKKKVQEYFKSSND